MSRNARPAGAVDGLEDERGLGHAEATAAELLGDEDGQPAGFGEGPDELLGVLVLGVDALPVLLGEPGAEVGDRIANRQLVLRELELHRYLATADWLRDFFSGVRQRQGIRPASRDSGRIRFRWWRQSTGRRRLSCRDRPSAAVFTAGARRAGL